MIQHERQPLSTDIMAVTPNHRACLVGFAGKGPVGAPTLVTNPSQLYHFYGSATPGLPLVLAAEQILAMESPVLMLRVAGEDAATATVGVPCSSHQIVRAPKAGPYVLTKNSFFRWSCNNVQSPKILIALKGKWTAKQLADQFNEQMGRGEVYFYTDGDTLLIRCNGQMELQGVQDSVYESLGLEKLVKAAELEGEESGDVELMDAHNLLVVVDGTGNLTVDNITQTISFKSLAGRRASLIEVANCINGQLAKNLPGGFSALVRDGRLVLRTTHGGGNASLAIRPASTARTALGFKTLRAEGISEDLPGDDAGGECFTVEAESPGTGGNAVRVQIDVSHNDTFSMTVYHDNSLVESWSNLTKNPKDKYYVESFVNMVSNWVRIKDNAATTKPPRPGTYRLGRKVSGTDGLPSSDMERRSLLVGTKEESGLGLLLDPGYDIDLIAMPGETSVEVLNDLMSFCQERGDCFAVLDTPNDTTFSEALKWKRQLNECGIAAAFWPWVKVYDSRNRTEVVVPPSGAVIAAMTRCDKVACVWNSPSGIERGVVPGVLDLMNRQRNMDRGGPRTEPELNAIVHRDGAYFIQGESALNGEKISLKRLVFLLKKSIRRGIDKLLRDCTVADDYFTDSFIRICTQILMQVKNGQGIQYYHIRAGDEINTPEVRAKGGFKARIGVQPKNTSLWVSFDFSLDTGVANKDFVSKNRRS